MAELATTPWLLDAAQAAQKYEEAAAVAAEACAEDTAGQTCYICHGEGDEDEGLSRGCACRGATGYAHVSCLARHAQHADERALRGAGGPGFDRWWTCGLCEQKYHGVVKCALGWAGWKTYLGRPEANWARVSAMRQLGNGLSAVKHNEDALRVKEAELALMRLHGASEELLIVTQSNLANTYDGVGRRNDALRLRQVAYSGFLRLDGEEHELTLTAANNYAMSLLNLKRFEEAKSLLSKTTPVARRALGKDNIRTLELRCNYAAALYMDTGATLDDLYEAVTILEETDRTARRVLGNAHPIALDVEASLKDSRAVLAAREAAAEATARLGALAL